MVNKNIIGAIWTILGLGFLLPQTARAATVIVGPGEQITTVGAGLAAANAGDTVLVRSGTYGVSALTPPSGVSLVSEEGPVHTKLYASQGGQAMSRKTDAFSNDRPSETGWDAGLFQHIDDDVAPAAPRNLEVHAL